MSDLELFETLLDGGKVALSLVVALAFVKLGRRAGDRLYHGFALAFVLLGVSWALIGMGAATGDASYVAFLPRLAAFVVIILAIVDKNHRARDA